MRAGESGQVRKEAALSGSEHVPRTSLARAKRHASARGPLSRMGRTVHFFPPATRTRSGPGMSSAVFGHYRGQLPDLQRDRAATAARAGAAVGAVVAPATASSARARAGAAVGAVVMAVMIIAR